MSEAAFFPFYVANHGILTKHHGFVIFLIIYLYYWLFYTIFAESYNLKAILYQLETYHFSTFINTTI